MGLITMEVNPEELAKLCEDLQLHSPVTIRFDYGSPIGRASYIEGPVVLGGTYSPRDRVVTMYMDGLDSATKRLPFIVKQLRRIILHEFRHAHQFDNWLPNRLGDEFIEPDADAWALANANKYINLFKVKRQVKSKLGRLSAAEERVR